MPGSPPTAFSQLVELERTGALADICRRIGIRLLVVFGSVVDPERAAGARDLDVAVLLDDQAEADLVTVTNLLVDLVHIDEVDVLDLGRAGPVAQEQALVGTAPLYEDEPGLYAAMRDRAMVRRMDTEWLRRLDLELMASS